MDNAGAAMSEIKEEQSNKDVQRKRGGTLIFSIREKFKQKPKAGTLKSRIGSFRRKRKVSSGETESLEIESGSAEANAESPGSVAGRSLSDDNMGKSNTAELSSGRSSTASAVIEARSSEIESQENPEPSRNTESLVTETSSQRISSPATDTSPSYYVNFSSSDVNPSSSATSPSSSAINPNSSAATNPSSTAINPSSAVINPSSTVINPSSTGINSSSDSTIPGFLRNSHFTALKSMSLEDCSVHSVNAEHSKRNMREKTLSLVEVGLTDREPISAHSGNNEPMARSSTVSVMASDSVKSAKAAAIEKAKERRRPPSKPLPYALVSKKASADSEATPIPPGSRPVLGPRSSRPPAPPAPSSAATPTHAGAVGRLPSRSSRPPAPPPPTKHITSSSSSSSFSLGKTLPHTPSRTTRTSPRKTHHSSPALMSPPTFPPPRLHPTRVSSEENCKTALPPRTVPRSHPPPRPSPASDNASVIPEKCPPRGKKDERAVFSVAKHKNKPTKSRSNPATLTRGITSPSANVLNNSAGSPGFMCLPGKPGSPMYEEIKNWIVGSDHPDAPKFSGAGLSVPGCSTHVRSDSSDVDEYVDMKSFLAGSSAPGMDDTYVEMRPVKDGEMMSTSDMQQQQEEEPLYMEMNPAALPPPPHLPAPPPPPPTEAPVSTLHPPPSDPAPIYATVQVTPPQDSSPGESLYYASRDMLLASKRH